MRITGPTAAATWLRAMAKGVNLSQLIVVSAALLLAQTSLALPPAAAVDWSHAQPINVLMVDSKFIPNRLTFRHGTPYQLHLENHGKDLHEFTAPAFLADTIVRDPAMLANGGQEIVLQPGTSVDVDLVPLKRGTYPLICADHDWADMTGEITVE
jgi:uncharacterized cupredoxin-like copper-binding protein